MAAATLSNVVNETQSAPISTPASLTLSASIDAPDASGNIPSGGGSVTLTLTATGIPDGTVCTVSATANDTTAGTATSLPTGTFPALSGGSATLDYPVPADAGPDGLVIAFQASTPGAVSQEAAAASPKTKVVTTRVPGGWKSETVPA
jgi:hypothetical protein